MVFRKPYAFLIKHFKLIHTIITFMVIFCIIKTFALLNYFNEYLKLLINITDHEFIDKLFPISFQIMPIIILLITTTLLVTMVVKQKPKRDYIITIIIYIYVFILDLVTKSMTLTLMNELIAPQTARFVRDLIIFSIILQMLPLVLNLIHATGFDIKKFDFQSDLKDFEINQEDREEVELKLDFDNNLLLRKIRRIFRYLKYNIKENKLLWTAITVGCLMIILVPFSLFKFNFETLRNMNDDIIANGMTLKILNCYVTNKNYKNKVITDDYYVILKLDIKNNLKNKNIINVATTELQIGNYSFIPTLENKNEFLDLGIPYMGEEIKDETLKRILIYKIPKQLMSEEKEFHLINKNEYVSKKKFQKIKVKLIEENLDQNIENKKNVLNEQLNFDNSVLKGYNLVIKGMTYANEYKINYDYCIKNECIKSIEYLKPNINENYDKLLMKIEGKFNKGNNIPEISNLYDFIEKFGTLILTTDDETIKYTFKENLIKSRKKPQKNIVYIEVPESIEKAKNITIKFEIRNKIYEYILK